MVNTPGNVIESIIKSQRSYFATHSTKNPDLRIENLKKFKSAVLKYESKIVDADADIAVAARRIAFGKFSNARAFVISPLWIDLPMKYPSFKYFKWIKRIV